MNNPVPQISQVGQVMTAFTISVRLDTPIDQASACMREYQIHHLPVTEKEKLIGVISARDIQLLKNIDPQTPESKLTVQDGYIDNPFIVETDAPLHHVLEEMAEHHYGSALVTENEQLVGIFTMNDACKCFAQQLKSQS